MTPEKLIERYREHNPGGHFFDKETLAFFGESVREMRVLDDTKIVKDSAGDEHECYVLVSHQRNAPPLCPAFARHYFDTSNSENVISMD